MTEENRKKPHTISLSDTEKKNLDAQMRRVQHLIYDISDITVTSRSNYILLMMRIIDHMTGDDIKAILKK